MCKGRAHALNIKEKGIERSERKTSPEMERNGSEEGSATCNKVVMATSLDDDEMRQWYANYAIEVVPFGDGRSSP